VLEKKGQGLNLSWEVRDGIMNHPTKGQPSTMEGKIIRLSDKIAYINHDIDDAIRGKILQAEDLPSEHVDILGRSSKERINRMIHDIIDSSQEASDVVMSAHFETAMKKLRKFMFQNVYIGSKAKEHEDKAMNMLIQLFHYFMNSPDELPDEYRLQAEQRDETVERAVIDYIAGMTDRYAINLFIDNFVPSSWKE
jgi:dGTPase